MHAYLLPLVSSWWVYVYIYVLGGGSRFLSEVPRFFISHHVFWGGGVFIFCRGVFWACLLSVYILFFLVFSSAGFGFWVLGLYR